MDDRTPIELTVREPTGLELGTFDIFLIRQKLYIGELHHRCEYLDTEGGWHPLWEMDSFAEVLWLLGVDTSAAAGTRVSRFAGWEATAKDGSRVGGSKVRLGGSEAGRDGKAGLLGRFFGKK